MTDCQGREWHQPGDIEGAQTYRELHDAIDKSYVCQTHIPARGVLIDELLGDHDGDYPSRDSRFERRASRPPH